MPRSDTGFSATDLTSVLNQSIVNFPTGSAEVPARDGDVPPERGAAHQAAPHGLRGDRDRRLHRQHRRPDANVALSQKRADAVRDVLVKAGVDPDTLVAKGYGSANPVASNDPPEGRFKNRRIEYRVLKAP